MGNEVYNFDFIWEECVQYNIEQKPEEYKGLLDLLNDRSRKRYALEIGSNYGGTTAGFCRLFDKVITIDIRYNPNFDVLKQKFPNYQYIIADSTSNDTVALLKSMGIKFDFIFIDGDHSYEGVKNDYDKFRQFLAHDGYMGFHDIVYSNENVENNARVDKLWEELSNTYAPGVYEFISPVKNHSYRTDQKFYTYVNSRPYASWGGIGVIKNAPVAVFCHNYLKNHWFDIVLTQMEKLQRSGLYKRADKILYGVFSERNDDYCEFLDIINRHDPDKKIEICRYSKNMYEYLTLIHLQNYCAENPSASVLYYHTKGTSRVHDRNIESWRECLEYFNIELWKKSIDEIKFDKHDICGALYVTKFAFLNKTLTNYYSGNFWWAAAKYINTLPNLTALLQSKNMDRDVPERWVGLGIHRWANYYSEPISNWYEHYFDAEIYKKIK